MVTLKVKTPKSQGYRRFNSIPPPIRFERAEWSKEKDDDLVSTFKLRTNPSDIDSQIFELKVRTYRTGTPEQFIMWKRDLEKVLTGQNVVGPPDKFAMARRLLDGDALAAFNKEAATLRTENNANFGRSLQALAQHVFPKYALATQKQWFRRSIHKAQGMRTREWLARLIEINEMLVEFPPNFNNEQKIPEDELKDIVEFGVPNAWRTIWVQHDFQPMQKDMAEIVDFCERIEYAEQIEDAVKGSKNQKGPSAEADRNGGDSKKGALAQASKSSSQGRGNNNKKRKSKHTSYADSDGRDGCALHAYATDHTTTECRVIMSQIGKMRAQWEANPRQQNGNKRQKTNNHDTRNQSRSNGDLHTLMDKVEKVKESLQKAMKQQQSMHGKRKDRESDKKVSFKPTEESEGEHDQDFNPDSFHLELDQLSISDDDSDDPNGQDE
jgi:hypothetical protein